MGAHLIGRERSSFIGGLGQRLQLAFVVDGPGVVLEHPIAALTSAGDHLDHRHHLRRIGAEGYQVTDVEQRRRPRWRRGVGVLAARSALRRGSPAGQLLQRVRFGSFNRLERCRRGLDHLQQPAQRIGIAVSLARRHLVGRQVRPLVADGLHLLHPVTAFPGQRKPAGQLVPVLIEDAQQRGQIELIQRGEAALLHGALLLEREAVYDVLCPPGIG